MQKTEIEEKMRRKMSLEEKRKRKTDLCC